MIVIRVEFSNGTVLDFVGTELSKAYKWAEEHAKEHGLSIENYEIISEE